MQEKSLELGLAHLARFYHYHYSSIILIPILIIVITIRGIWSQVVKDLQT